MRAGVASWQLVAVGLAMLLSGAAAAKPKMLCPDWTDEACYRRIAANPPMLTRERLPQGYKIGRCLFVVDGKRLIDGICAYDMGKGGNFHIEGPHQVFDGIDYPKADGMAAKISTDWWADVFRQDGGWTGYSNSDDHEVGSVHGQSSRWGTLARKGACYANHRGGEVIQQVRVCLWKT